MDNEAEKVDRRFVDQLLALSKRAGSPVDFDVTEWMLSRGFARAEFAHRCRTWRSPDNSTRSRLVGHNQIQRQCARGLARATELPFTCCDGAMMEDSFQISGPHIPTTGDFISFTIADGNKTLPARISRTALTLLDRALPAEDAFLANIGRIRQAAYEMRRVNPTLDVIVLGSNNF